MNEGRHAVLVGAGNIGSHASSLLARTPEIDRLTVIDRDDYERKNLESQDVDEEDVGRPKAIAQVRRLRRVRTDLEVRAVVAAVEDVPLARLRADVLLAAVDNNRARQAINDISLRLDVPWVDAAIEPESLLARVNVYRPGPDRPCLECAWDGHDYERLGAVNRPCDRGGAEAARSTSAPSALGALAASLAVIEIQKLLDGRGDSIAPGQQVLIDAGHHQYYRTTSRRNPRCRVGDHAPWALRDLPAHPDRSLAWLFERAAEVTRSGSVSLGIAGHPFVRTLACAACGHRRSLLRVDGMLTVAERACDRCGGGERMAVVGFDLADVLTLCALSGLEREMSLADVGVRTGDVLQITSDTGDVHRVVATAESRDHELPT